MNCRLHRLPHHSSYWDQSRTLAFERAKELGCRKLARRISNPHLTQNEIKRMYGISIATFHDHKDRELETALRILLERGEDVLIPLFVQAWTGHKKIDRKSGKPLLQELCEQHNIDYNRLRSACSKLRIIEAIHA